MREDRQTPARKGPPSWTPSRRSSSNLCAVRNCATSTPASRPSGRRSADTPNHCPSTGGPRSGATKRERSRTSSRTAPSASARTAASRTPASPSSSAARSSSRDPTRRTAPSDSTTSRSDATPHSWHDRRGRALVPVRASRFHLLRHRSEQKSGTGPWAGLYTGSPHMRQWPAGTRPGSALRAWRRHRAEQYPSAHTRVSGCGHRAHLHRPGLVHSLVAPVVPGRSLMAWPLRRGTTIRGPRRCVLDGPRPICPR